METVAFGGVEIEACGRDAMTSEDACGDIGSVGTTDPDDADPAFARWGCDGCDGGIVDRHGETPE